MWFYEQIFLSFFIICVLPQHTSAYQTYDIGYACERKAHVPGRIVLGTGLRSAAILTLSGSTNSNTAETPSSSIPYNSRTMDSTAPSQTMIIESTEPSWNTVETMNSSTTTPDQMTSSIVAAPYNLCSIEVKTIDPEDGIFLAIEQVQLNKQKTCREYVEIYGTTSDGRNRTTKLCGNSVSEFYSRSGSNRNVYEESFTGNITLSIRADKTSSKPVSSPRLRLVMTTFKRDCQAKSMFICNPSNSRPENNISYMAAKFGLLPKQTPATSHNRVKEEVCVFKDFVCDTHVNCPVQNRDEASTECLVSLVESNVVMAKKDLSGANMDSPSMGQLLLGALVFLVAILSLASCQWVCRRNTTQTTSPENGGSFRDRIRASITRMRVGSGNQTTSTASGLELIGPPPSYEQVQLESDPPPLYESLIAMLLNNKTEPTPGPSTDNDDNLPRNSTVITILPNEDSSTTVIPIPSPSPLSEVPSYLQIPMQRPQKSEVRLSRHPTI